ncbi:MAG: TIGR01458 family HAD-type hydrolase [Bryobacteraceae bacterium]|jgi:HAD superfamily hydrolase (TIGR01458 family)
MPGAISIGPCQAVRGVLFDMDGVIYNDEHPIAGAAETIEWVQAHRVPHLFLTNTTSKSRGALCEKLMRQGIRAAETEILTPGAVVAEWLRTAPAGPIALFVREPARREFAGLPCLADDAERGARYVIVGDLGELWDYRTLNRAFRLLHNNKEAELIALGMTRYWLASDGLSLDVAPFVAALEHAAGRKALVFGKPAARFFLAAAERLSLAGAEVLMIGDDIEADVAGAQAAGLKGALVRTGKFHPADLEGAIRPDVVLDSIAGLPAWWNRTSVADDR